MYRTEIGGVCSPCVSLVYKQIVVVAELVAFAHLCVGVVQVILHFVRSCRIRSQSICVYVVEYRCAEQVFHSLVVHTFRCLKSGTDVEWRALVELHFQCRRQREHQLVVVLGLYVVHGIFALCRQLLVGVVQTVEVDLTVGFWFRPEVVRVLPVCKTLVCTAWSVCLVPHIVETRRQVLPVVGVGVVRVAVVQLGTFIVAVLSGEGRGQLHAVVNLIVPCQHGRGRIVVHYARVALLAVLISPVRIVISVVGQPVCLVCSCTLRCAFRRVAPCHERKAVLVADDLLHTEEVRQRVVERSFHISSVCPTVHHCCRICPSLVADSGVIGVSAAKGIVTVGSAQGHAMAYRLWRRPEIVVVWTAHGRHGETVVLERQCKFHVACLGVQSSNHGISELPGFGVVHRSTVDVDLVVLLIEGTIPEPDRTEQVAHLTGIQVAVGIDDGHVLRHVIVFSQLSFGKCESLFVIYRDVLLLLPVCALCKGRRSAT